jgi:predicted dehydrogenase
MSTPDQLIRLGILGTARIAPWAAINPAKSNPDVTVAAIAARDQARAEEFASQHNIDKAYGDYAALLNDAEIDAVYVPLPNSLHATWSTRALEAGKHVLCEKPLAANAMEAEAMVAAADASRHVLAEAFHYRYHPLAQRARAIVQSGELGALRHIDVQFCTPSIRPNNIRFDYALGGGVTMDLGCYAVDMIRFLTGEEPTVTQAKAKLSAPQVDRTMDARLNLASGATAHLFCSMLSTCLFRTSVRVAGEAGSLSVANMMLPQLLYHRLKLKTAAGVATEKFEKRPTYDFQMQAFVDAIRGDTLFPSDGREGLRNMRVIDAIYAAAGLRQRGLPELPSQLEHGA